MKTYLMTMDNKPIAYVFDEDTTVSYTLEDVKASEDYFTAVFKQRTKLCNEIGAQPDYARIGMEAGNELFAIATKQPGDELLNYLKAWREKYKMLNVGLKVKDGIKQEKYNDTHRITKEQALRQLEESSKCF